MNTQNQVSPVNYIGFKHFSKILAFFQRQTKLNCSLNIGWIEDDESSLMIITPNYNLQIAAKNVLKRSFWLTDQVAPSIPDIKSKSNKNGVQFEAKKVIGRNKENEKNVTKERKSWRSKICSKIECFYFVRKGGAKKGTEMKTKWIPKNASHWLASFFDGHHSDRNLISSVEQIDSFFREAS